MLLYHWMRSFAALVNRMAVSSAKVYSAVSRVVGIFVDNSVLNMGHSTRLWVTTASILKKNGWQIFLERIFDIVFTISRAGNKVQETAIWVDGPHAILYRKLPQCRERVRYSTLFVFFSKTEVILFVIVWLHPMVSVLFLKQNCAVGIIFSHQLFPWIFQSLILFKISTLSEGSNGIGLYDYGKWWWQMKIFFVFM